MVSGATLPFLLFVSIARRGIVHLKWLNKALTYTHTHTLKPPTTSLATSHPHLSSHIAIFRLQLCSLSWNFSPFCLFILWLCINRCWSWPLHRHTWPLWGLTATLWRDWTSDKKHSVAARSTCGFQSNQPWGWDICFYVCMWLGEALAI